MYKIIIKRYICLTIMQDALNYLYNIDPYEGAGLIFGLLAVIFLVKENIWTWPCGILYVAVSFVIFWEQKLYMDFGLNIFYLVLNIYGWWYWIYGKKEGEKEVPITHSSTSTLIYLTAACAVGIVICGYLLKEYTDASLPYWDSTTTILSLAGMWLTTIKRIDNWYYWFVVDVLCTVIYFYKGIQLYALLYCVYIGLAVSGYLVWKKSMEAQSA
ncbi:nicotinamide riboside transporter PnuC [Fulvivirga maritima]|uniref:nicotinamide riboside transporter PnuC n=1 Tax=Fulvivirga maritima TaxID=2904247 RepID=UPI001F40AAB6|nr:nicotinamide riboside transporter PnuC [Fulvivirga maritima]UII28541.1 nicotinamide riboside transporter PnuC [Fulvivirga maritima]